MFTKVLKNYSLLWQIIILLNVKLSDMSQIHFILHTTPLLILEVKILHITSHSASFDSLNKGWILDGYGHFAFSLYLIS